MRTTTIIALAAALGEVNATFRGAKKFTCPSNTVEVCDADQERGFDWQDLADGFFSNFGGLEFTGWECKSGQIGKRDSLTGRSFGSRAIYGVANGGSGSSFGCGNSQQVNKFSIGHFDISVEFDVDLEFHYDMADGSKCKHRSRCSKDGTTVKNTQCGGAKNVTVVYPEQPAKPSSCSFGIHSMSFHCGTPTTTTVPVISTTASTVTEVTATETAETTSDIHSTTSEVAETSETGITISSITSHIVETTSTADVEISSSELPTGTLVTSSFVTTTMSLSTVFETSLVTVTSCAPTIVGCPADETVLSTPVIVTHTVAISTTLCPVTETMTTIVETTHPVEVIESTSGVVNATSSIIDGTTSIDASTVATTSPTDTTSMVQVGTSTEEVAITTISSETPVVTLPCPDVVPSCLNTWMFTIGCSSNTDAACYCPDSAFVENIFSCIYSHGEADNIIQEAVEYFQGICAGHVEENPAIVTGAETVTTAITVTPTHNPSAVYTTIQVHQTTVIPCEENGTTIPFSSSTVVVSTEMTVPQVTFETTVDVGQTTSDVVLVPVPTTQLEPVVTSVEPVVTSVEPVVTSVKPTVIPVEPVPTTAPFPIVGSSTLSTLPGNTILPSGTGGLSNGTPTGLPVQFTGAAAPNGAVAFGAVLFGIAGAVVAI